jgi:hypothetical protein
MEAIMGEVGLSAEERAAKMALAMNQLRGKLDGIEGEMGDWWIQITDILAKSGYDISDIADRQGQSAKGLAQASQDSIDELNGRMTAIQGHTSSLVENTRTLVLHSAETLRYVRGIADDTTQLYDIKHGIGSMQVALADINRRGVKLRTE